MFVLQRVSKQWLGTIQGSHKLKVAMFLMPTSLKAQLEWPTDTEIDRIDKDLHQTGIVAHDTLWLADRLRFTAGESMTAEQSLGSLKTIISRHKVMLNPHLQQLFEYAHEAGSARAVQLTARVQRFDDVMVATQPALRSLVIVMSVIGYGAEGPGPTEDQARGEETLRQ